MIHDAHQKMPEFVKEQIVHWEMWLRKNPHSKIKSDVLAGIGKLRGMV